MTDKALDTNKIQSLLKYDENKSRAGMQHAPKWPTEKNMKALTKAVIDGTKTVELDGRKFKLRYIHKGYVNVNPVSGGLTPCGCFDIESLTAGVH